MGKKNLYDPAFKARVALEAVKEHESLAQIGQRQGVHAVRQWKKKLLTRAAEAFTGIANQPTRALLKFVVERRSQVRSAVAFDPVAVRRRWERGEILRSRFASAHSLA